MEFFKLNFDCTPGKTVKKFNSLVWAERYQEPGDFNLVVENDVSILTALPLGTLVSHTNTLEVMIVENHEIVRGSDRKLTTTVSGRSLEAFAENRVTVGSKSALYTGGGVAITETTASLTPEIVARNLLRGCLMDTYAPTQEALPFVSVYNEIVGVNTAMTFVIPRGDVYSAVNELLGMATAGIKNKRPNGVQTTLDMVVHDGTDRSVSVIFYAQRGDLSDETYFWSNRSHRNWAHIATHTDARLYQQTYQAGLTSGFTWRVMYIDANDLEGNYTPGTSTDVVAARAQGVLDAHRKANLMTAKVTDKAKPKFKIHYDVGDKVMAFGEFSSSSVMRVTEHILTVDKNGARGYPSLSIV